MFHESETDNSSVKKKISKVRHRDVMQRVSETFLFIPYPKVRY